MIRTQPRFQSCYGEVRTADFKLLTIPSRVFGPRGNGDSSPF